MWHNNSDNYNVDENDIYIFCLHFILLFRQNLYCHFSCAQDSNNN